jgi:DNA polymerase-3 subunit beta
VKDGKLREILLLLCKGFMMKAEFNRTALAKALSLVASVVPARTPKPILRCVRLSALKEQTWLAATDLEVGISCLISEVSVRDEGEVVIPADKFSAIVRESADDVLVIESAEDKCSIKGSDSHFTVYEQPADQYPSMPDFDGKGDLEISLGVLQGAIKRSLFATAKESTRYALNGVLWEIKGKKLSLVATDGRRLARVRVPMSSTASEKISSAKIIVPAKTMSLLEKIEAGEKDVASVKLVDNQILVNCANAVVSSNLVEGNFPKYEDIIPTDYEKKLSLSTEAVSSAVRRAALLTSEESRGIRLAIGKGKMIFSGRAPETGDAEVEMSIDYKGEPLEIGFNPAFITDALRVIETADFELELGTADRPGLVKSGSDFIYVLMPINLS